MECVWSPRTSSSPLREWTTLHERRQRFMLTQVHKCLLNLAPPYRTNKFKLNSSLYTRTRVSWNIHLGQPKSEHSRSSFEYSGALHYNRLPLTSKLCHHEVVQNLPPRNNVLIMFYIFYNLYRTCMKTYRYGGCSIPIQMNYLFIFKHVICVRFTYIVNRQVYNLVICPWHIFPLYRTLAKLSPPFSARTLGIIGDWAYNRERRVFTRIYAHPRPQIEVY